MLLLVLPLKSGNFIHSGRLFMDNIKNDQQQVLRSVIKPVASSKKLGKHQQSTDGPLCHTPKLNNFGYGSFTIYYSLLKFGSAHVISLLHTKTKLDNGEKDSGHAVIYLSFLLLLAGDIQLNPGPNTHCTLHIHTTGVEPGFSVAAPIS